MGRKVFNFDGLVFLPLFFLSVFGLFILSTVDNSIFTQQLIFSVAGLVLLVAVSRLDRNILYALAPYFYIFSIIFLISSYFGPSVRGATRWILVFGTQVQPSEFAKPFILIAFAWLISKWSPRNIIYLPLHFGAFILAFLLVFKQPDLGSSIIYFLAWLGMMIAGGFNLRYLLVITLCGILLLPSFWKVLAPYQMARIQTFVNPALDPKGAGYNSLQATIAVGSGRMFGRGLGRGTQSHMNFLPEFHTDFIFATLVEELGFFGALLLFLLYFILLMRLVLISWVFSDEIFAFIYIIGLFSMIIAQVFINSGMNMGILPVTGITLPFISYGGSSLLSLAISFGFFNAIARR